MFPSYKNQSIDLHCKSIACFLYDGEYWSVMGQLVLQKSFIIDLWHRSRYASDNDQM